MLKAYKYRLYPNVDQEVLLDKAFGCVRYVWNWALDKKTKAYEVDKKKLSYFDLANELPELKKQFPWLKDSHSQTLQMALRNLDNAFNSFFKKNSQYPKFKSKHKSKPSCQFPQGVKLDFYENTVEFPKLGSFKAVLHRKFEGAIKTVTVSRTSNGGYFASLLIEDGKETPSKAEVIEDSTTGIDVGIKTLLTLSNGTKIDNPKFLKRSEHRLKILQRRLSKKTMKTSVNRQDVKRQLSKHHEKVSNQRKDFLHKVSHKLVSENQTTMIVCEDLNIEGMLKNHKLAKSISDVAWSKFFEFTKYKCDWQGKTFQTIGRFDPSTKICNVCGSLNNTLTLKDREWDCPNCKIHHDRDLNVAINIKKMGYIRFLGTGIESKQSLLEQSIIS
jgi:putative transposase